MNPKQTNWLEYCPICKRKHIVTLKPCQYCRIHLVPTPVSEKVENSCGQFRICEGCDAYLDHLQ